MKADKPTQEDIDRLKVWIEANNYTVYTVLRHVARSGTSRHISVVIPIRSVPNVPGPVVTQFVHPSYTIASILGWSYSEKSGHNAIVVTGAGMDMGFYLVESLSYKLYGEGKKIRQEWI